MARVVKAKEREAPATSAEALNLDDLAEDANRQLLEARREAARIISDAQLKSEAAGRESCEKGYAEGFDRGRKAGYEDGLRAARDHVRRTFQAEMNDLTALVRKAAGELKAAGPNYARAVHAETLDFAVAVAEKIVGRVAVEDIEAARTNLRKALELAEAGGRTTLSVNPAQLLALRAHCAELVETLAAEDVRLIPDESIACGGVRLRRRLGEIDATIGTQLENVIRAIRGRPDSPGRYLPDGDPRARQAAESSQRETV